MSLLPILLAPILLARAAPPLGQTGQDELYPPVRHATLVHAFSLPDEIKADVVRKALADLSTKDADCRIAYGPVSATARPKKVFLVVEAPAALDVKDVIKALKKGVASVEPLAWTCFESPDKTLGRGMGGAAGGIPGFSPRDFVLGMSNDLRWVEARGGFTEFFFSPGKISPTELADRFHKLAQPFGISDVGTVVEETFTWSVMGPNDTLPLDPAAVKRAEKACTKLSGVMSARIDAAAGTIEVTVALADLVRGIPPIALPAAPDEMSVTPPADSAPPPRMRFDTNALLDVLAKESLSAAPGAKKEGGDAGPKKGG